MFCAFDVCRWPMTDAKWSLAVGHRRFRFQFHVQGEKDVKDGGTSRTGSKTLQTDIPPTPLDSRRYAMWQETYICQVSAELAGCGCNFRTHHAVRHRNGNLKMM
jgi:hypothetical protein